MEEKAIQQVLEFYNLDKNDILVSRKRLEPSKIYVAAVEECNLETARDLSKTKYADRLPDPITVLEYKGKHVLFKGSNRGIVFVLKGQNPDCIIVKLPENMKEPKMVSEAKITLEEIIS